MNAGEIFQRPLLKSGMKFVLVCLVLTGTLSAQLTKVDSLRLYAERPLSDSARVEALNNLALVLYSGDEAVETAASALQLAKRIHKPRLVAKSYATLAWVHSFKRMDVKTSYLDSAEAIALTLSDKEGLGTIYNTRASIQIEYGDFEAAIGSLEKAYEIFDALGNEHRKAVILNNWAVVLNGLNQPEEAYKKAASSLAFRESEDPPNILELGRIHFVIGSTYMNLARPEEAANHFLDSYRYRSEAGSYGIAEALLELAVLMMHEAELNHDTLGLHRKLNEYGFRNSQALIDSAARVPTVEERQRFTYKILDVKRLKALVDKDYQRAYELLEEQKEYNESSKLSEESLAAFVGLRTKYEQEQLQSKLLREEILLGKRDSQLKFLMFFLGLMLLLLVIGVLIHQNRLRRQQIELNNIRHEQQTISMRATLEGQEKERARIARDLHDGLGNLLSTVKVTVAALSPEDNRAKSDKLDEANLLIDEACSEVRKISHEMMPQALARLGLSKALEDLILKIDNTRDIEAEFHVFGNERKLDDHTRLMLFRITQELLNNTLKYSQAGQVTVQLTYGSDWLNLTVEDDGVGFDMDHASESDGMGLKSIAFRAADIGASYEIESKPGKGCLASISLPLNQKTNNLTS